MLENNIKLIMLAIGVITCSMLLSAFSPTQGMLNTFGATFSSDNEALANVVVRSWAMLITITGGLLIYGAFKPMHRKLVIVAACISKAWFVALNLIYGQAYMDTAIVAVVFDSVAVIVLMLYFFTAKTSHN